MTLHRYWITFERTDVGLLRSHGLGLGMGVTAFDESDMEKIVSKYFKGSKPIKIEAVEADVRYEDLEKDHQPLSLGSHLGNTLPK